MHMKGALFFDRQYRVTLYTKSINHLLNVKSAVLCQMSCQDIVLFYLKAFVGQYDCVSPYKT